jgi:hypothetical protein
MRTTSIIIHNSMRLEFFVEKRKKKGFEVWIVGPDQERRTLLDHHLTHDDLEARMEYARSGDLIWRDAMESEIPTQKHRNVIGTEETIKQGIFWDFDKLNLSITGHLGAIALLSTDKREWNAAKKAILGRWTDGIVTLDIKRHNALGWSCTDRQHPLNVGERVNEHAPNYWSLSKWRIFLVNSRHKCGTHVGILQVTADELHLESGHKNRIARIFRAVVASDCIR